MTATVTESYDAQLSPGQSAIRRFLVSGADSAVAALGATGVPAQGDAHPEDPSILCVATPTTVHAGPGRYEITAEYGTNTLQGVDPVGAPPRVRVSERLEEVPIDTDINGNPIVNSAGQPFGSAPTGQRVSLEVSVTVTLPAFSFALATLFAGATNSDTLSIGGSTVAQPFEAVCVSISPTSPVPLNATSVQVEYRFLVTPGKDNRYARIADLGTLGIANDDGTDLAEPIYTVGGDGEVPKQVDTEVPLNGTGQPFDPTKYQVGVAQGGSPSSPTPPPGATLDVQTHAVWLLYTTCVSLPFSGLVP